MRESGVKTESPIISTKDNQLIQIKLLKDILEGIPVTIDTSLLATAANQATEIARLTSILSALGGALTVIATNLDIRDLVFASDKVDVSGSSAVGVTGPLTDAQLRATPVPVSGTVTVDTSLLSTAAKQDTGNASLASIAAEDFSTSALQTAGNASLSSIAGEDFATEVTLAALAAVDFATEAKQDDEISALNNMVTALIDLTQLVTPQGNDGTDVSGPLIQGLVNDSPQSYQNNEVRPVSLTSEGRLRVSSVDSYFNKIWQGTFDTPWGAEFGTVANSDLPFAGEVDYV